MNRLVLDVGTTNVKAHIFDNEFNVVANAYKELSLNKTNNKVEQDPNEIINVSIEVIKKVITESKINPSDIEGMGMTVQRETVIVWNKNTGLPVYPAISWQDNRTEEICNEIKEKYEATVKNKTGLSISPYFSASKIAWIFEHTEYDENLIWGTVDTWLIWNLLKNKPYITDYTNASRTMLFNIKNLAWDKELFDLWKIGIDNVPKIAPSIYNFGILDKSIFGFELPLVAICGDQQASMYAALKRGVNAKITFGTGTFLVQELDNFSLVEGFFTTLLPTRLGSCYALEAKIGEFGKKVAELLEQNISLDDITKVIAENVKRWVQKLPSFPYKVIIDGGITQSPFLIKHLKEMIPQTTFIEQPIFDGTSLGVAYMIKDSKY